MTDPTPTPSHTPRPHPVDPVYAQILDGSIPPPACLDAPAAALLYQLAWASGNSLLLHELDADLCIWVLWAAHRGGHRRRGATPPRPVQACIISRSRSQLLDIREQLAGRAMLNACLLLHATIHTAHALLPFRPTLALTGPQADALHEQQSILHSILQWTGAHTLEPVPLTQPAGPDRLLAAQAPDSDARAAGCPEPLFTRLACALLALQLSPDAATRHDLDPVDPTRLLSLLSPIATRPDTHPPPPTHWPWAPPADHSALPDTLPHNTPWPRFAILTPWDANLPQLHQAHLSIRNQLYPAVDHILLCPPDAPDLPDPAPDWFHGLCILRHDAAASSPALPDDASILAHLPAADLLAPQALAGVAMAFHLQPAEAVAGLTEHRDLDRTLAYSAPLSQALPLADLEPDSPLALPPGLFLRRSAVQTHPLLAEARVHVIGRTVRITQDPAPKPESTAQPTITLLNDVGHRYGAGSADARMVAALRWAGLSIRFANLAPDHSPEQVLCALEQNRTELLILGNLHAAQPDPSLAATLAARFPTFCILHDLWPLTGRCAHPDQCTRYLTGCDHTCPTPTEYPALHPLQIAPAWQAKQAALHGHAAITPVANSRWAQNLAQNALLRTTPPGHAPRAVYRFRLGLPADVFKPRNKALCREILGLPQDRFIVMIASAAVADPHKGAADTAKAIRIAHLPDLLVVAAGHVGPDQTPDVPHFKPMGYLTDPRSMAMLYSAADVYISATSRETFGKTLVEAAACGTPVLVYPSGGAGEAVIHGLSGLHVPQRCPEALAQALCDLHARSRLRMDLAAWGSLYVHNEHTLATCAVSLLQAIAQHPAAAGRLPRERLTFGPDPSYTIPAYTPIGQPPLRIEFASGFGPWEDPMPQLGLPRFRWAYAPAAEIDITVPQGPAVARFKLVLHLTNLFEEQRLTIADDDRILAEWELPATPHDQFHVRSVELALPPGQTRLWLLTRRWKLQDGLRLALIIRDIHMQPLPPDRQ